MKKFAYSLIALAVVIAVLLWIFFPDSFEPEPVPIADQTTVRSTEGGDYVGFIDTYGARAWLGIAFAQPPVGELRWKAPLPPITHEGAKDATKIGSACIQFASAIAPVNATPDINNVVGNEDCLYLNVWSAPNTHGAPVMVWLHGGGNTIGHGGSYNGARLATAHNVVVVTINYRLGLLGWFFHPKVSVGSLEDQSGNYGTLDVVRALEWVRDNIGEFGGDPSNVTLFGESAGARDTLAMMASPIADGLFHKAIVQSGGYWSTNTHEAKSLAKDGGSLNSSTEIINRVLARTSGASNVDVSQHMSVEDLRLALDSKHATEFYVAIDGGGFSGMVDLPQMVIDGHVVPETSAERTFGILSGFSAVPVILGTNRDEPSLFMFFDPRYTNTTLGVFRSLKDETEYLRRVYYGAQGWKVSGVDSLAQLMTAAGHSDVYAYRFDWDEEPDLLFFDLSKALGAAHGLEIPFVFGGFGQDMGADYFYPHDENQRQLTESMMSYWAEFAYNGDPGRGRSNTEVEWLAWGEQGKSSILLDTPTDGGIRMMDEIVTFEKLMEELLNDQAISSAVRCEIYRDLRSRERAADVSDEEAAKFGCVQLPEMEVAMEQ